MKRSMTVAMVVFSLVGTIPSMSEALAGRRNTTINPVNGAVFEVIARGTGGADEFWCGAADYARRALGAGWKAKIVIARTRGPAVTSNRRSAVHFTVDPKAAGVTVGKSSVSLGKLAVGDNMSVQQANLYCQVLPDIF